MFGERFRSAVNPFLRMFSNVLCTVGRINYVFISGRMFKMLFFPPLILETTVLDNSIIWVSLTCPHGSYMSLDGSIYSVLGSRTYSCRASETWPHIIILASG